ncbi:MAG: hypothetical protein JEZ03_02425 [Bacteroidales bacterium]|nr:hypothetical protein [Bacteroidales bacterium]
MTGRLRSLFLLIFTFSTVLSFGQYPKSVPQDSTKYMETMEQLFKTVYTKNQQDDVKAFLPEFEKLWFGGVIEDTVRSLIYKNTNELLKRRLPVFPYFFDYLNVVHHSVTQLTEIQEKINLFRSFDPVINSKRTKPLSTYLSICKGFFTDQTLYSTGSYKWSVVSDSFNISYDTIPSFSFEKAHLICSINTDSSILYDVKGTFFPFDLIWEGQGGKMDWRRAGWASDSVYALLPPLYRFPVDESSFSIDTVNFYNKLYFDEVLIGTLKDKVQTYTSEQYVRYPQFSSYEKRLNIQELFPGIDYHGGFKMEGNRIIGYGDAYQDAVLLFRKSGEEVIRISNSEYLIKKGEVTSRNTRVSIYLDNDSIFHPGINLKYDVNGNKLFLNRAASGVAKSPYYNSYHKLDMFCESLVWDLNDTIIDFKEFKGVASESQAVFESVSYFSKNRFLRLQGMDDIHPLASISNFHRKTRLNVFYLEDLQMHLRLPSEQVEMLLIHMANMGFLIYDTKYKKAVILEKLFNYLKAQEGKQDYDVIQFQSITHAGHPNASLNVRNNDLLIQGVPQVFLSDSQQVYIYPRDKEIIMKKNRDFLFSGRVHAGLFDIYGDSCSFDYNSFTINLPMIDSVTFAVQTFDADSTKNVEYKKVNSTIADLSGQLKIDFEDNKSGLKPSHEYPILENINEAFVYYDHPSIYGGAYDRERIKYHVYPFVIDSLDNFSTEGIKFDGYFETNIFPDIEQPLEIMPDYSLGFSTQTPEQGLDVYGAKGMFFEDIGLSNAGLIGAGKLEYLCSLSVADSLIFFPDSMNAYTQNFLLEEQFDSVEFPSVHAEKVNQHWLPYADSLLIYGTDVPFSMYANQTSLKGNLTLTPEGLRGDGTASLGLAEVSSDIFTFKNQSFDSDTALIYIQTTDKIDVAAKMDNYSAEFDFKNRYGRFQSNTQKSVVELPVSQYLAFMDKVEWMMDEDELVLEEDIISQKYIDTLSIQQLLDVNLDGAEFVSLHPDQDSLSFYCFNALFDLKQKLIQANKVKYVEVADAAIFPDNEKLVIHKHAALDPLFNAKIIANTENKAHELYKANVEINSRNSYSADGMYSYFDEKNNQKEFVFSHIGVDSLGNTIAEAEIAEIDKFMLSPNFAFKGKVSLNAIDSLLQFSGGYRIVHDCDCELSWVAFSDQLDPKHLVLPMSDSLTDLNNNPVFSGIAFSKPRNKPYPLFLTSKESAADEILFRMNGIVAFDNGTQEYKIASQRKLDNFNLIESYFNFNRARCIMTGDGEINLVANSGRLNLRTIGNLSHFVIPDSTVLQGIATMDFHFSDQALNVMGDTLRKAKLKGIDVAKTTVNNALVMLMGEEATKKYQTDIALYGAPKRIPVELLKTFVFADLNLEWNQSTRSFVSVGEIGVSRIGKTQVNKYLNGFVEIAKYRNDDEITVYLELEKQKWYYFNYSTGIMQALSSDNKFNNIILQTKESKRKLDAEDELEEYEYVISTVEKKNQFIRKMKRTQNTGK